MANTKPVTRMRCIQMLIMSIMITTALKLPHTMAHAVSFGQTITPTDQLAILTKRMNELEDLSTNNLKELNKRVHELSELREHDMGEITRLNQQVTQLERLRVNDLHVTTMLTRRIEELERPYDKDDHVVHVPILPNDETPYYNTSDVTLPSRAAPTPDDTTTKEEDMSTHVRTPTSNTSERSGRIQARHDGRITRISPSNDTVAFHAILTYMISDPVTTHPVIYNQLITNTGGVHYSTDTGVFTCTQSGVHVFSWSIYVAAHHYVDSQLVRNNAVIGSAETGQDTSYFSAGSATAATHLEVGDEVWVRVAGHLSGSDIYPTRSMFTGFRLR